jgi:HSP20 family molecular chaperone IbpA
MKGMKMLNDKKRYSIPAKILELLYGNDNFFNEVVKINKGSYLTNFPKTDEWRDEAGFNISFALAGYSPEDITVEVENSTVIVRGNGLDSIANNAPPINENDDAFQEYSKEGRPRIHIGSISRGIARRKFSVKLLISEEFNVMETAATMRHGLLHVIIPVKETSDHKIIKIKDGNDERN